MIYFYQASSCCRQHVEHFQMFNSNLLKVVILFSWKPYRVCWWPHALCHSVVCFKVIISLAAPARPHHRRILPTLVTVWNNNCIRPHAYYQWQYQALMGTFSLQLWGEWPDWLTDCLRSPAMLAVRPLSSPLLSWLDLQTFPCSPHDNTNCRYLYFQLYYSDCTDVTTGWLCRYS